MKTSKKISLLLSLATLASCANAGGTTKEEADVTINGYNTISDLYRSKLVYPFSSYNIQCRFDINTDAKYIKEGEGSLKMYMNSVDGGDYSYFVQRFSQCAVKDRNIGDVNKFSLWLYNANETDAKASLVLVGEGETAVTSTDVTLKANQWNYCEYDLSRLILENSADDLLGFGVLLKETPGTYYLDDWQVHFGAEYTKEDLAVLDQVNAVSDKISKLNLEMDFTKESENAALNEACAAYYEIDSSYRGAVKGKDSLEKLALNYCDYLTLNSGGTTAFNFSKGVGVSQVSVSMLSAGVSVSYSKEHKRPGTDGSMKISSNGSSKWVYLNWETSATVSNYSKFGIWFYNDSSSEFGFCIQWNETAQYIKPKGYLTDNEGWQYCEYSCAGLSGKVEFEYCAVAEGVPGGVLPTSGDIYVSDIVLIK